MTLSVNDAVMSEVKNVLLDPTGRYWTDAYLMSAYNIIVTAVIADNANALTKVVDFPCAAGVDQIVPSDERPFDSLTDGVQFLRAAANVNGPTIRQVTAESLQEDDEDWYAAPPNAIVRHVILDEYDPLRFRVYPPNDGTGSIRLQYAYAPLDIVALTDPFGLTEAYRLPVRNGILGMAYALNTDRQDLQKSQVYLSMLSQGTAMKVQAQNALMAKIGIRQTTE